MSLWHLLVLWSGAAAFGAAFSAGRTTAAHASWLGVVVGLGVGVVCMLTIRWLGSYVTRRIEEKSIISKKESAYRNLYVVAFAWIIISSVLGFWITKWIIQLLAM